ncbi:MAG: chemotaxis protein CheA [Candidatus Omnitrophica bacterium]|nr:chemotaxis protein CheA [Candidatus Omnitrophota bacterium]
MADWKKVMEGVDGLAAELVLADLSCSDDFNRLFGKLASLRSDPDVKSQPALARALVSAATAASSLKASAPARAAEILSSLCGAVKAACESLDRGADPSEHIKFFEVEMKASLSGGKAVQPKTLGELQAREIPGFLAGAKGMLDEAEQGLLALEKSPQDKTGVDSLFRIFHTIKGEANLTGLAGIGALSHEAEDYLGVLRAGTIQADAEVATALLKAVDHLRGMLEAATAEPSKVTAESAAVFVRELQGARAAKTAAAEKPPEPPRPPAALVAEAFVPTVPVLDLANGPDLFLEFVTEGFDHLTNSEKSVLTLETDPDDKEAINNIFRAFHTIKGAAGFLELRDIRTLAHEAETMLDMVRKGVLRFSGRVVELTLTSIDAMRKLLTLLQEQAANNGVLQSAYPDVGPDIVFLRDVITGRYREPVGEILIKQGAITDKELEQALKIQKEAAPDARVGDILVATNAASAKQVQGALETQKAGAPVESSIKIQLEKLDTLIDMVGELVISETQVVQSPEVLSINGQRFHRNISELDRITRSLQQVVMGMRLVPVGPVFQKMVRLVRDLSKKLGKEVALTLSGEDTEIDKNMVELVADPLMHMVRNSLDHGIEPKEVRLAAGKPAAGKVELSAYHKGGYVVIEIRDDGGGLRKDRILSKAIERGLVKQGENLPDSRIFNLIFEPGFSTAEQVTDVSGRGVGMDVVKRNIEKLRGKIDISSEAGKGSVFAIYLPITLAIIEGIVVRTGQERYILPINSVVEFVHPQEEARSTVYGKGEMYKVYDKVYPLIYLGRVFGVCGAEANFEGQTICIVESDYGQACVVVDELLGQQQVVIKSLGERLKQVQGLSGAAILGDGRVGLILDVNSLVALAVRRGAK